MFGDPLARNGGAAAPLLVTTVYGDNDDEDDDGLSGPSSPATRYRRGTRLEAADSDSPGRRFMIATGGPDFVQGVLGITRQHDDEDDTGLRHSPSASDAARTGVTAVRLACYTFGGCLLSPCRSISYFTRHAIRHGSRPMKIFASFGLLTVICSILQGLVQISTSNTETSCAIRYGNYASCCDCVDLDTAFELANITHGDYDAEVPRVADRNGVFFGSITVTTGFICIVMLYQAVTSENPYLVFFAVFALFLQLAHDIFIAAPFISHAKDTVSKVRIALLFSAVASLTVATITVPWVVRHFGLVGVKLGGLGAGAVLHGQYLKLRTASYVDQLATYTFAAATSAALATDFTTGAPDARELYFAIVFLFVADVVASALLSVVVRREFYGGTLLAVVSMSATFVGWTFVMVHYDSCYRDGLDEQRHLRVMMRNAGDAGIAFYNQLLGLNAPFLYPSLSSVAAALAESRACIATGTVFDSHTTILMFGTYGIMALGRLASLSYTLFFVMRFFGTKRIAGLFFVLDERVDEQDDVLIAQGDDE
jgi:hypothetical protein